MAHLAPVIFWDLVLQEEKIIYYWVIVTYPQDYEQSI